MNPVSTQMKQVDEFVNFYLLNAKNLVLEVGYVPLPDDLKKKHYSDIKIK